MKIVSIFDLRDNLASYLTAVRDANTSFVVRRFGKPIAVIAPYRADEGISFREYFGFLPKNGKGEAVLSRLRRSAGEKKRTRQFRGL